MGYSLDLKKISLEAYKENLKTADLLPSHTILKNGIEEQVNRIKKQKIENVEELRIALRSRPKRIRDLGVRLLSVNVVKDKRENEMVDIKKGDLFNRSKLIASQKNIAESGYFKADNVGINPIPHDGKLMDISLQHSSTPFLFLTPVS